jgi:hypothetical protein
MKIKKVFIILSLIVSSYSNATSTGDRTIKFIGCHVYDNTSYVTLDKVVTSPNWSLNNIRWSSSDSNGKEILSLLMSASMANKKVNFNLDGKCMGKYPKFNYLNVIMS